MADNYCTNCKNYTEVVFDHSAGDTICLECGLVLESRSIDDASEWFGNFAGDNRFGSPDGGMATVISKQAKLGRNLSVMFAGRERDPDKIVIMGFKTISTMPDKPVVYKFGSNFETSMRLRLCKHKRKRRAYDLDLNLPA